LVAGYVVLARAGSSCKNNNQNHAAARNPPSSFRKFLSLLIVFSARKTNPHWNLDLTLVNWFSKIDGFLEQQDRSTDQDSPRPCADVWVFAEAVSIALLPGSRGNFWVRGPVAKR